MKMDLSKASEFSDASNAGLTMGKWDQGQTAWVRLAWWLCVSAWSFAALAVITSFWRAYPLEHHTTWRIGPHIR